MRDSVILFFGLFFALIFFIAGVIFLSDSASNTDAIQSVSIIGGAVFLSLGVAMCIVLKKSWRSRRAYSNSPQRYDAVGHPRARPRRR
jgi:hypothetical protein